MRPEEKYEPIGFVQPAECAEICPRSRRDAPEMRPRCARDLGVSWATCHTRSAVVALAWAVDAPGLIACHADCTVVEITPPGARHTHDPMTRIWIP